MQGSKQEKKEKYTCKFYLQGTCKNGVNCKFMHPVNAPQNNKQHNNDKKFDEKKDYTLMKQNSLHMKDIEMVLQKSELSQEQKKHPRDEYYEKLIDSMKITCFSCHKRELPVYLSCGCWSICEKCVKQQRPCGGQNHKYDSKVYIK